jgi:hypothetical protein
MEQISGHKQHRPSSRNLRFRSSYSHRSCTHRLLPQNLPAHHKVGKRPWTASPILWPHRQQTFPPLSPASGDIKNDTYRPRNTSARRCKSTTSRVTPRSEKHARELKVNLKAATKYRNRQRSFVENLQKRCRREEEKMHVQTSLVHALHDEVVALRGEVMRQSFRGCHLL